MFKYNCLNPIAAVGLDLFSDQYDKVDELKDAQEPVPESTISRWTNAQKKVSSYSIHRVQMQTVSKSSCLQVCSMHPVIS